MVDSEVGDSPPQNELKNEQIDNRIEAIKNNADVEYYDKVQKTLPSVIDSAVTYAMGDPTKDEIHYEEVVKDSLKATKRLMVFYRLREDKKVVEILIRSKVHERVQEWKNKEKKNKGNT